MTCHATDQMGDVFAAAAGGRSAAGRQHTAHALDYVGDRMLAPAAVLDQVAKSASEDGATGIVLRVTCHATPLRSHWPTDTVSSLDATWRHEEASDDQRRAAHNCRLPR